jgi:hypothetical protein
MILSAPTAFMSKSTDAVGQGFLAVLSAQGSRDEHDDFQPAQIEYVGEPQAGQNLFL